MYHILPSTLLQLSRPIIFGVRDMAYKFYLKHASLLGVSETAIFNLLNNHPKITWQVEQLKSPASSFLKDRLYFPYVVPRISRGRKNFSIAWNKVFQMW